MSRAFKENYESIMRYFLQNMWFSVNFIIYLLYGRLNSKINILLNVCLFRVNMFILIFETIKMAIVEVSYYSVVSKITDATQI